MLNSRSISTNLHVSQTIWTFSNMLSNIIHHRHQEKAFSTFSKTFGSEWNQHMFNCLMTIRITLEPTNDEAVHILSPLCPGWWCLVESWKSHGFWVVLCMLFRWLLVFWIYLFIYLNYPSLVTGCLIVAALSTDSLSMTSSSSPWSVVTNLSISIIPLWSFFLSNR